MTDAHRAGERVWTGPPVPDRAPHPCDTCGVATARHRLHCITNRAGTNRLVATVVYECLPCECRRQIARLTDLRAGRTADHPGNPALDEALDYWRETLAQQGELPPAA